MGAIRPIHVLALCCCVVVLVAVAAAVIVFVRRSPKGQ
jgi:hypothetical protein